MVIRSDQGGEYKSKQLDKFYRSEGIVPQYTAAYSPQQNGTAERKNRSLMEMARCMLIEAKFVNTATYLQNILPSRSVDKTPHEWWYGAVPDLKHLQVLVVQHSCTSLTKNGPNWRRRQSSCCLSGTRIITRHGGSSIQIPTKL